MPISVNAGGRNEVMLIQTLEAGEGVMAVVLCADVKIQADWGMGLPSSPPIIA